jgi:uncharacterized protein
MQHINWRSFRKKFEKNRKRLRIFITKTENNLPKNFMAIAAKREKEVWGKIKCLDCANCCKKMTPTYTSDDIKRISAHLGMRPADFKKKWLYYDKKGKDWMNTSQPCQFLDRKTNMCTIYEVRPADCADFPHLTRTPFLDYMYVHKQNIEYCPATMLFIEKIYQDIQLDAVAKY